MRSNIELKNGIVIFLGIGIFFLLMDFLGLADKNYLRILNAFIVLYGINESIKMNIKNGKTDYLQNLVQDLKQE